MKKIFLIVCMAIIAGVLFWVFLPNNDSGTIQNAEQQTLHLINKV